MTAFTASARAEDAGSVDERNGTAAIDVIGLSKSFGQQPVLSSIDLRVEVSEFVVIVGASGCGKSTLLRLLAGLEKADAGRIEVGFRTAVGFQDARLLPWMRVWENVVFGVPGTSEIRRETARRYLDDVGLQSFMDAWPNTLSGGQAQRVSLARALALEPRILLLDEPFGALDALTRLKMHALTQRLWREHMLSIVLVTHDIEEAVVLADRIVVLRQGSIVDQFRVEFERPRKRGNASFEAYRSRLLNGLGVDEDRE